MLCGRNELPGLSFVARLGHRLLLGGELYDILPLVLFFQSRRSKPVHLPLNTFQNSPLVACLVISMAFSCFYPEKQEKQVCALVWT